MCVRVLVAAWTGPDLYLCYSNIPEIPCDSLPWIPHSNMIMTHDEVKVAPHAQTLLRCRSLQLSTCGFSLIEKLGTLINSLLPTEPP